MYRLLLGKPQSPRITHVCEKCTMASRFSSKSPGYGVRNFQPAPISATGFIQQGPEADFIEDGYVEVAGFG